MDKLTKDFIFGNNENELRQINENRRRMQQQEINQNPLRSKAFWWFLSSIIVALFVVLSFAISAIRLLCWLITKHDLPFSMEWLFYSHYGLLLVIPLILMALKTDRLMKLEVEPENKKP